MPSNLTGLPLLLSRFNISRALSDAIELFSNSSTFHSMTPHRLAIKGMHCASCAARVESALSGAQGVSKASVDFSTRSAWIETPLPFSKISEIVSNAGYEAVELGAHQNVDETQEIHAAWLRVILAAVLSLPVIFNMLA